MKEIKTVCGRVAVLIDDEDYERVLRLKWYLTKDNQIYHRYSVHGKNKYLAISKFILNTEQCVDHKDRNPLNNQKENLRKATQSQNSSNRVFNSPNKKSRFRGVVKSRNKWKVEFADNGKKIVVGYFENENAAALVYNEKAKELKGEFAILNVL